MALYPLKSYQRLIIIQEIAKSLVKMKACQGTGQYQNFVQESTCHR